MSALRCGPCGRTGLPYPYFCFEKENHEAYDQLDSIPFSKYGTARGAIVQLVPTRHALLLLCQPHKRAFPAHLTADEDLLVSFYSLLHYRLRQCILDKWNVKCRLTGKWMRV